MGADGDVVTISVDPSMLSSGIDGFSLRSSLTLTRVEIFLTRSATIQYSEIIS